MAVSVLQEGCGNIYIIYVVAGNETVATWLPITRISYWQSCYFSINTTYLVAAVGYMLLLATRQLIAFATGLTVPFVCRMLSM